LKIKHISFWVVVITAILLLTYSQLAAQDEAKTVIGPRNVMLADGANELLAGNSEEGVRLTLRGLEMAQGSRERKIAHANLCAGYTLMDKPLTALQHCNWVLERDPNHWRTYNNRALAYLRLNRFDESEADIARGQELSPKSTNLKIAKGMLLDETDPVTPTIEIDERRSAMDEDGASDAEN
jgi:tetratricopeptide (TPR) repeat protein